jgi:HemY protein
MRALFWLVVVFAAAVALVVVARVDSGYVLFFYPPYRVEMSVVFFAVAALATFVLLHALFRVLGNALSLPATVRA